MALVKDIWSSFMALPLWVRLWMLFLLMPINFAALLFWEAPFGKLISSLAILGMAFNLVPILLDRGFGKAMSIPHLIFWVPLTGVIILKVLPIASGNYRVFLMALLAVNLTSLIFDIVDTLKWIRGDRAVAR